MKIIKSTKNSTSGNVSIKAATNKNSSVRLQMKEELMDQILPEIKSKLKEIMTSYQFGYDDNEWEDYSGADIYLDNRGYIVITVYAEVSYKGLVKIMDALNPIVEKYDSDAYFDADTPGRCSAYIDPDNIPSNMYPYDDIQNSEKIYSSQSQYSNRTVLKYKNKSFTIYDNSDSINLPADSDFEALRKWKAQISQQAGAYNDADEDYEWASLSNGVVSYYRRGKLVDKSYYMSPSDWGVETLEEWFQLVINDVIENLYEANRDVPDHMVYNSTDIEASTDDKAFIENIEDIIDGLEDNGYDLDNLHSIKEGLWALFGYQGKDADEVIEDLVAGGFIDSNVLIDACDNIYSNSKEYKTSETYRGRRIRLLNDGTGYAIFEKGEMIDYGFKSLEDAEAAIDEYDDIYQDDVQVYSATEEDEEDLPMVDQEYDSAATSINSNKLPAIYKMVNFNEGDVIVDFGGGKFDNAVEYIRDKGATLCVYDPYNRSAEHNREVLRILRENGGADAAVNSNVLNVIKEPEARKNVLENIARITKPGAPIYITVYEGKGNGQEGPTKSGYQLNRKTADYLEEIQEVFPDATRRGKLITAHNTGSVTSSTDVQSSSTILCSYDEFITWYDNLSDEEQWKVDDIADTNGIPFYEEASDDELSWLHDVATIGIHASADTVEGASNEVELDPEESMIDMNIDQYIIVDSEGSWDYDSDNYDWASSDGEGSDWYSDNGVRLDDPIGVVEKIDELIEPHVPIEPGTYRVEGYIELYYTVSGVYENRYDYTEDDYSSDINSDFGSAEYNKKLSKIENVKVTKI